MAESTTPYYSILDKLDSAIERLDFLFKRHMFQLEVMKRDAATPPRHGVVMLRRKRRGTRKDTTTDMKSIGESKEEEEDEDKTQESESQGTEATEEEPAKIEEPPKIQEQPPVRTRCCWRVSPLLTSLSS